jgi:hypothetical protein
VLQKAVREKRYVIMANIEVILVSNTSVSVFALCR